jgi:hypothetical protein
MSEPSPELNTMRDWVALVVPASVPVILENDPEPTAPRPDIDAAVTTYAIVGFVDDDTATSTPYDETTDTPGSVDPTKVDRHSSEVTYGDLGVEFYGPGSVDYARTLRLSITRPDVIDLLNAAGDYAINKAGPVGDEPILRSATREPHASIQFEVQWVESAVFETEAVETIVTTVDIDEE